MGRRLGWSFCTFVLLGLCAGAALGLEDADSERPGHYANGEVIPLFVDTVAPYHNPQESYRYYSLKYCMPEPLHHKAQSFGEVLQGSEKAYSPYHIEFKRSMKEQKLCTAELRADDIKDFLRAVEEQYQFHMYLDDIPIKGFVGEYDDNAYWIYIQHDFHFEHNHDRIITANVTTRDPSKRKKLPVDDGLIADDATLQIHFSYSVTWTQTSVTWDDRPANNPAEVQEEEIEIQWFSIVNSTVLVILVTGFLVFILMRILKKDVQAHMDTKDLDDEEESGWKQLHGDVFRPPPHVCLFSSVVGTGVQILLLFIIMLTLAVLGVFSQHGRGTMYAAILVVYSLAASVAGYASAALYAKLGGTEWVNNVLCTVGLFAVPAFVIWAVLNTVAIIYSSTVALPFGTIVALFAFYFFVTFPFTLAGAIAGKNYGGQLSGPPAKSRQVPRQIPEAPWYRQSIAYIVVAGFLPFSAIYVELYYVFISLWGHQLLTPYGILYLVFVILLMVTVCITIALTYLQFTMENWKWWWFSIFSGGATANFIYAYCFYFLLSESKMSGFMQVSYYFGYMLLICYALFLMLGSVGFYGTMWFVEYIYSAIKAE